MQKVRTACFSWLVLTLFCAGADAQVGDDAFGAREFSMGGSLRGAAIGSAAISLNPSGVAMTPARQLVFDASYGHRKDTSLVGISACDASSPVQGCFYYRFVDAGATSAEQIRSHEFGSTMAKDVGSALALGATVRYIDSSSEMVAGRDYSGFGLDLGATLRAGEVVQLGLVGHNLVRPSETFTPRGAGGGAALLLGGNFTLVGDAVWTLEGPGKDQVRTGGGAEYFITSKDGQWGYPLRAGGFYDGLTEASYGTAGLGVASAKFALDLGGQKEMSSDGEYSVVASLRLFGPTL